MAEDTKSSTSLASDFFTGRQLRAARALAGLSGASLAAASGVSLATLRRAEAVDGAVSMTRPVSQAITKALHEHGVVMSLGSVGPGETVSIVR